MAPPGDPSEWPTDFTELREIDTLLRCGVCYEVMETAMIVPACSHNYCSLCIRKYMSFNNQCPTCRISVTDLDLKNNRVLDELIKHFSSMRSRLLSVLLQSSESSKNNKIETQNSLNEVREQKSKSVYPLLRKKDDSSVQKKDHSPFRKRNGSPFVKNHDSEFRIKESTSLRKKTKRVLSDSEEDEDFIPPPRSARKKKYFEDSDSDSDGSDVMIVENIPKSTSETSSSLSNSNFNNSKTSAKLSSQINVNQIDNTSNISNDNNSAGLPRLNSAPSNLTKSATTGQGSTVSSALNRSFSDVTSPSTSSGAGVKKVSCPVCGVPVAERYVNIHLDRCLNAPRPQQARSSAPAKRKTLPKLVYNLMGDKEVRKRLAEVGLPTQGDRRTLIKRHQEFTLIYNTQCDSLNPKSAEDIVREMQKSSAKLLFKPAASSKSSCALTISKGASAQQIESAQKSYLQQHKSQFDQLIAETKARMKRKKEELQRKQKEEAEKSASTDVGSVSTVENSTPILTDLENSTHSVKDLSQNENVITNTMPSRHISTSKNIESTNFGIDVGHCDLSQNKGTTLAKSFENRIYNCTEDKCIASAKRTNEDNDSNCNHSGTLKRIGSFQSDSSSKDMFYDDSSYGKVAPRSQCRDPHQSESDYRKMNRNCISLDSSTSKEQIQPGESTSRSNTNMFETSISHTEKQEHLQADKHIYDVDSLPQKDGPIEKRHLELNKETSAISPCEQPIYSQASSETSENLAWLSQTTPLEDSQRTESYKSAASFTLFEDSEDDLLLRDPDSGVATVDTESVGSPVLQHGMELEENENSQSLLVPNPNNFPSLLEPNPNNNFAKPAARIANTTETVSKQIETGIRETSVDQGNISRQSVDKSNALIEQTDDNLDSKNSAENVSTLSETESIETKKKRKKRKRKSKKGNQTPVDEREDYLYDAQTLIEVTQRDSKPVKRRHKKVDITTEVIAIETESVNGDVERKARRRERSKGSNNSKGSAESELASLGTESQSNEKQNKREKRRLKKEKDVHLKAENLTSQNSEMKVTTPRGHACTTLLSNNGTAKQQRDTDDAANIPIQDDNTRRKSNRRKRKRVTPSESELPVKSLKKRRSDHARNEAERVVTSVSEGNGDVISGTFASSVAGSTKEITPSTKKRSRRKVKSTK